MKPPTRGVFVARLKLLPAAISMSCGRNLCLPLGAQPLPGAAAVLLPVADIARWPGAIALTP
jgi:hypothetical protein